jgi:dipeptidyl aminopeptidase/acylaminoacyl peptidase
LFSAEDQKEIEFSNKLFENPWSLRFVRWTDDEKKFWLHYNQRGHQIVRLIEVEVATGKARTLIEETSETFIHYSNGAKSVFKPLPGKQVLWASERSGWNHLYRYDHDGQLINAVTNGNWNVKRIEKLDYENEQVWFYAVGIHEDQDPYHQHFCRVNFDGSGFRTLTEGDGTHKVRFEQEGKYLIDTFSRVDMAPVTQLRDSESGELVVEMDRQETESAFDNKRKLTARFTAKGRDGETDIWGIIHWPRDFDPEKTYPVIEYIYAGPHDHHVPKSFGKRFSVHKVADAGFIVVQIDGMGTAWRSKAFHDVCYKNLKDGGFPDRIAWMKAAAEQYPQMDISRVGIYGGSAGGQNAMAALLWHNDFYQVAVADCGCHDNRMDKIWWNEQWMGWPVDNSYVENSNMENAHLLKGHLMLTVGEMDRNVDPATTTQVVKKLIEADKDFEFVLIPGAGHGAGERPWAAKKRLNFFRKHLQSDQ